MDKWSMITYLSLWVMILLQGLTIHDLKKQLKNEKKWSEYWSEKWLKERSRQ